MKAFVKKGLLRAIGLSERDLRLINTVKEALLPQNFEPREQHVPNRTIGNAGFSLDTEKQLARLRTFEQSEFQELFHIVRKSDEINIGFDGKQNKGQELIHNGYYPTPDAELYAAMILSENPDRIIEVGSGFSTLIARTTIRHTGAHCSIHVIDPQPRTSVESIADQIEYKPVERSSLTNTELSGKTLLFIDSSHVCRADGDLPYLFCKILPALPAGVLVHIHDIFLPFDYPDNYFELFYNEQYLLHALLANSTKFEVVLATHFLAREHRSSMQAVFGSSVGVDPLFYGSSFWIRSRT